MEFDVTDTGYCVYWSEWELQGRPAVLLVFHPLRLYREQQSRNISVQVHRSTRKAYRKLPPMPDGLYEYYLSDEANEPPITKKTPLLIGAKRSLSVKLSPRDTFHHCLELTSPLPLKSAECGIDYGLCRPVPLPGTQPDGNGRHKICCLLRVRPELSTRLWYTDELRQMLLVDEQYLSQML